MITIKAKFNYSYLYLDSKLGRINKKQFKIDLIKVCSYELKKDMKTEKKCLIHKTKKGLFRIPLGLSIRIQKVFDKYKIKLKFIEYPKIFKSEFYKLDENFGAKLRSYQKEGYDIALKTRKGILHHATGAGKTELAASLIFSINKRSLYLVPNITLLRSTAKRLKKLLPYSVGIFGDKIKQKNRKVTIATAQSIYAWLDSNKKACEKWLKKFECFVSDEAHHDGAKSFKLILLKCINAQFRYGFTATVKRGDGATLLLTACCGEIIHTVKSSDLIKKGYLAKPYFYFIKYDMDQSKVVNPHWTYRIRNWHKITDKFLLENEKRNNAIIKIANKIKKKFSLLIICNRVKIRFS